MIRNKRDAAHLADNIDPNLQDATLVSASCDWIMAELVRLFHGLPPDEAQRLVEDPVTRKVPVVQEFGDVLKTLNPRLQLGDRVLVLLYHRGPRGASIIELNGWVKPSHRKTLGSVLWRLEYDQDLIIAHEGVYKITRRGQLEVERRQLVAPSE